MDFERRIRGLQQAMAAAGMNLAVYGLSANFQYLTGLSIDWRSSIKDADGADHVFVPRNGDPVLVLHEMHSPHASQTPIADVRIYEQGSPYTTLLGKIVCDLGVWGAVIGTGKGISELTARELRNAAGDNTLGDAQGLMDHLRLIKEPGEIERLRKAAEMTDKILEAVVPCIKEGVTQPELGAEVELQARLLGASGVSFSPAALFAKSASEALPNPFTYPREQGLVPCTSVAFDFGVLLGGYCSDFGRSFYFGRASGEVKRGYAALRQGLLDAVAAMHVGMRICDILPVLENTMDRLGFGDYLRARLTTGVLGHSIGIEVHEDPWIRPDCEKRLQPNMVLALEPKIWHAGEYYLRIEDMVLVGSDQATFLTSFDREWFEL